MSERDDLMQGLEKPFPKHALKSRQGGGGKALTYVETETVIRRLNEVAKTWDFRITDKVWRDVTLYDKEQRPRPGVLLIVFGELTIPGLGTRTGTGVQIFEDKMGSEDMVKGAQSDCLKKAAVSFGVGIDLYGPDLEAGEVATPTEAAARNAPVARQNGPSATIPDRITDWTVFWSHARKAGVKDREDFEAKHGPMPSDPQAAMDRIRGTQPPPATAPAVRNPADAASDKQINFIRGLAKDLGMTVLGPDGGDHADDAAVAAVIGVDFGEDWPNLSKGVASQVIEQWRDEREHRKLALLDGPAGEAGRDQFTG